MTEERDPKVSGRYRELEREEPSRALDDAILAASRRAARRRPWLYPAVGVAAVMVLAVAISVQVEREQPDATAVPTAPVLKDEAKNQGEAAKREEPAAKAEPQPRASSARKGERRSQAPSGGFVPDPKPAAPAPEPLAKTAPPGELARRDAAGAGAAADRVEERASTQGPAASAPAPAAAPRAEARMAERPLAAMQLDEAPMPWLERIAKLRGEGKHEEADRALAEFRKRYPDFKISDEMLKRVER